ncbi:transmembrane protein 258 [Bradysia coprophila]|uniref:transmembrane protein 258 n=1 Tax=Bradysia coprophila TaxID=38358 RepID=UPI00187D75EF|nr:transmembrane protein 258 [Bradysia coprophila]
MDSSFTRYVSPVNPSVFPHLATVLLTIGTFFTAWFFVFEVSRPRSNDNESPKESVIFKELLISLFAAVFLGFGALFLLLTVGIYV